MEENLWNVFELAIACAHGPQRGLVVPGGGGGGRLLLSSAASPHPRLKNTVFFGAVPAKVSLVHFFFKGKRTQDIYSKYCIFFLMLCWIQSHLTMCLVCKEAVSLVAPKKYFSPFDL